MDDDTEMTALRLVAVVRVSTKGQESSGLGIEAQRSQIERYAEFRGHRIVRWIQEAQSGKSTDRVGLNEARALVEDRFADGIIVSRIDRLARSMAGLVEFVEWSRRQGSSFIVCESGIDTSTPTGVLMAQVMMAVAEFERSLIRERTREALAAKRARGGHVGSVPLGFMLEGERAVPDPAWDACRSRAAALRSELVGQEAMCGLLPPRPDGRAWTRGGVRRLLVSA